MSHRTLLLAATLALAAPPGARAHPPHDASQVAQGLAVLHQQQLAQVQQEAARQQSFLREEAAHQQALLERQLAHERALVQERLARQDALERYFLRLTPRP